MFGDQWLVSALIMLVAASPFGEGIINELVSKLFVGHPTEDSGDLTCDTVSDYC